MSASNSGARRRLRTSPDAWSIFAGDREAAVLGIEAQLAQLRFRALLARRYARVDRHPRRHHPSSAQQSPVLYTLDQIRAQARGAAQGLENPEPVHGEINGD